jgi:hypothetical protein
MNFSFTTIYFYSFFTIALQARQTLRCRSGARERYQIDQRHGIVESFSSAIMQRAMLWASDWGPAPLSLSATWLRVSDPYTLLVPSPQPPARSTLRVIAWVVTTSS